MSVLVVASAVGVGLGVSVLTARVALAALLAWTYSGTARASSLPAGVRSRTPALSSADSSV